LIKGAAQTYRSSSLALTRVLPALQPISRMLQVAGKTLTRQDLSGTNLESARGLPLSLFTSCREGFFSETQPHTEEPGLLDPDSQQQGRNCCRVSCAIPARPLVVAVGPIAIVILAPIPAHLGLRRSSRQSCYECSYRQDQQQALHDATSFARQPPTGCS
jgi:hypothetical protein